MRGWKRKGSPSMWTNCAPCNCHWRERRDRLSAELRTKLSVPCLDLESLDQLVKAFGAAGIDIPNTREDRLVARSDPLLQLLREYRRPASLASYVNTLLEAQHEGRIHAAYSSTCVANGRFSCENPDLQNAPRDRELCSCFRSLRLAGKLPRGATLFPVLARQGSSAYVIWGA